MTDNRKLTRDFLISIFLRFASAGITFAFVVFIARIVTVEDYGVIGTIMAASLLFSVIGSLGQQTALLRFIPPALEKNEKSAHQNVSFPAFRLAIMGNLTAFAALAAIAVILGFGGWLSQWQFVLVGLAIIPLTGLIDMQSHLARAHRFVAAALLPKDILWRLISLFVLAAVVFTNPGRLVPLGTVVSVLVGVLLALVLGFEFWLRKRTAFDGLWAAWRYNRALPVNPTQRSAIIPFWVTSVSAVLFVNLDVIAVGILLGAEPAALYFAANRVAMLPRLFMMSQVIVAGPVFAGHYAAGRHERLRAIARRATLLAFLPTLGCCAVLFVLAHQVLWVFGSEFVEAASMLQVLLLAALFNAALGPTDLAMKMCGHERTAMISAVVGMIGGTIILTIFGVIGNSPIALAYGVLAAVVFAKLVSWALAWKRLGFSADAVTSAVLWNADRKLANNITPGSELHP